MLHKYLRKSNVFYRCDSMGDDIEVQLSAPLPASFSKFFHMSHDQEIVYYGHPSHNGIL